MKQIAPRKIPAPALDHLLASGYTPALAKIYAARGVTDSKQLDISIAGLLPFDSLKNAREAAQFLADAIAAKRRLTVIADYDADGATACAVAVRGLRAFGALIDFVVPNRFEYGYGLTPEIVHLAAGGSQRSGGVPVPLAGAAQMPLRYGAEDSLRGREAAKQLLPQSAGCASNVSQQRPDILITVDNGIASVEGVAEANRLGMQVLVTDHHLPGETLPDAACIVNPNQPGCMFPSKHLAGVGVMFYVLLALRAELRARGAYSERPEPKLGDLLDLVALGTVADVVRLDQNNRILVQQGLQRIRAGRGCAGINALLQVAKKSAGRATSQDLGFTVGPRLNAAGRLDDMRLGIDCLLTDDIAAAMQIAAKLDALNRERRGIEADMQDSALATLAHIEPAERYSLALFDESWHQGVIGILAARIKDRFHRPVIAFARANDGELKGSGRSIAGLHLRDALDLVSKRHPSLIKKFGGHAAAAGLSIAEADFENFVAAFEKVSGELLGANDLEQRIETDGALEAAEMNLEVARLLDEQVWGQGFPAPQFSDDFIVQSQRVVGEKHLKLQLRHVTGAASRSREQLLGDPSRDINLDPTASEAPLGKQGKLVDAILFGYNDPLPEQIKAVYSLGSNEYNGTQSLQLIIRHWLPAEE